MNVHCRKLDVDRHISVPLQSNSEKKVIIIIAFLIIIKLLYVNLSNSSTHIWKPWGPYSLKANCHCRLTTYCKWNIIILIKSYLIPKYAAEYR